MPHYYSQMPLQTLPVNERKTTDSLDGMHGANGTFEFKGLKPGQASLVTFTYEKGHAKQVEATCLLGVEPTKISEPIKLKPADADALANKFIDTGIAAIKANRFNANEVITDIKGKLIALEFSSEPMGAICTALATPTNPTAAEKGKAKGAKH